MKFRNPFRGLGSAIATIKSTSSVLSAISNTWNSFGGVWRVREPYSGAWQENIELSRECILADPTVYACTTLITNDIAKLYLCLKQTNETTGTSIEVRHSAWSPVIDNPNGFQNRNQFITQWMLSKLIWGNTYVLLRRDARGIVNAMYVLDPRRVQVMVATDGSVFYDLSASELDEIPLAVTVPSSEIIHDRNDPLFHPLCGLSPLFAASLPASTSVEIRKNATHFFRNGAKISGILQVPGALKQEKADDLKKKWNDGYTGENAGKVAVLADGVKFQPLTMNSTDAQMIEMLKLSAEQICSAFHVPAYMVGVGSAPAYNNIEALSQAYYNQCLQIHIESIECLLDKAFGLEGKNYNIEFDLDGLLRMDQATMMATLAAGVGAGIMSPDEARARLNLPPVDGGATPYLQQQNFSLSALNKRDSLPDPFVIDKPTSNPTPSPDGAAPAGDPTEADPQKMVAELLAGFQKQIGVEIAEADFVVKGVDIDA